MRKLLRTCDEKIIKLFKKTVLIKKQLFEKRRNFLLVNFSSLLVSFGLLLVTFCFLLVTRYFLLVTRYFVFFARYFLLVARYFLLVARYFLLVARYFLLITRYLLVKISVGEFRYNKAIFLQFILILLIILKLMIL